MLRTKDEFEEKTLNNIFSSSFTLKIILRLLYTLKNQGNLNKTNLAGKSGLNYAQCVKYVTLMQFFEWVELMVESGTVSITEKGLKLVEKFASM